MSIIERALTAAGKRAAKLALRARRHRHGTRRRTADAHTIERRSAACRDRDLQLLLGAGAVAGSRRDL